MTVSSSVPGKGAKITAISPQFLVEDLDRAIAYYRDRLGFAVDFTYESFYASVSRDGFAIHLKHGHPGKRPRRTDDEPLDAYLSVSGIEALFAEWQARGAVVIKPLEERPWGCVDFYVADPDGNVLCCSEPKA